MAKQKSRPANRGGQRANKPQTPRTVASATPASTTAASGTGRAQARKAERDNQRRRQRLIVIAASVAAAVALVVILAIITQQPTNVTVPADVTARYQGIETGTSVEGFPVLGAASAPVDMQVYSSFDCTSCERFHGDVTTQPAILDRVRDGSLKITYIPVYGTGGIQNGEGAARAALCVAEQSQAAFWPYHDVLFDFQSRLANRAYTQNNLLGAADAVGTNGGTVRGCLNSANISNILERATNSFDDVPVGAGETKGTPFVLVNGTRVGTPDLPQVQAAVEQAIASAPPVIQPEVTAEAAAPATEAAAVTTEAAAVTTEAVAVATEAAAVVTEGATAAQ